MNRARSSLTALLNELIVAMSMQTKGMEAYLDESGITQGDICVMAGFVGGYNQWRTLARAWNEVVKSLPNMDFHAKAFFARDNLGQRTGPYKRWDDTQAREFLDALLACIDSVNLHPIGAAIDYAAFNRRTLDERVFLTGARTNHKRWLDSGSPDKPYYLAFQHCVTKAIMYSNHARIRVNIFCDAQRHLAPYARELYERYKTRHPLRVTHCGVLTFVDRTEVRIVQAADLLAHVVYRYKTNPTEESNYALMRIIAQENQIKHYNEEGIRLALHNYRAPEITMGEMNPQAAKREFKRSSG